MTLHFDIEKLSFKDLSSGYEKFSGEMFGFIDVDITQTKYNFTPPKPFIGYFDIRLDRDVLLTEVRQQKLTQMPGFKFNWYYSGMEVVKQEIYNTNSNTKAFVRYFKNIFISPSLYFVYVNLIFLQ